LVKGDLGFDGLVYGIVRPLAADDSAGFRGDVDRGDRECQVGVRSGMGQHNNVVEFG